MADSVANLGGCHFLICSRCGCLHATIGLLKTQHHRKRCPPYLPFCFPAFRYWTICSEPKFEFRTQPLTIFVLFQDSLNDLNHAAQPTRKSIRKRCSILVLETKEKVFNTDISLFANMVPIPIYIYMIHIQQCIEENKRREEAHSTQDIL